MKTLKEILFKPIFFTQSYRACRVIESISTDVTKKFGVEKQSKVLHLSDGDQEIFIIQIFSKRSALRKTKIIALLSSLIVKKAASELAVNETKIRVILNIADPLLDSFLTRTDKLKIKNIEYLIDDSINQRALVAKENSTKAAPTLNNVVIQSESDSIASVSVSEIDFEEYLNVATNKLRTLIAEKREEQKTFQPEYLKTEPSV